MVIAITSSVCAEPNALNADETAAHTRTARFSIAARAALKLLNLGIMTAEKLMKFNAIAWNALRTSADRAVADFRKAFWTYVGDVCRNIDST